MRCANKTDEGEQGTLQEDLMNTKHPTIPVSTCFLLLLLLLSSGCIKQGLPISYYTLSPSKVTISPASPSVAKLVISAVTLPPFLDQGQIISRESPYSVRIEEQRRWAGELSNMITQVVKISLTRDIGNTVAPKSSLLSEKGPLQISLHFTHFEKSADGSGHLMVNWEILSKDASIVPYRATSSYTIPTDDTSFEALAKALSIGLERLSLEIVEKLLTPAQP